MTINRGKKYSNLILSACLILAIIGYSCFSMGESRFSSSKTDELVSAKFISAIDHTVDFLAEAPAITNRLHGNSSSLLRAGFLRVFVFSGIYIAAVYFSRTYFQLFIKNNAFIDNNNIPLKLLN